MEANNHIIKLLKPKTRMSLVVHLPVYRLFYFFSKTKKAFQCRKAFNIVCDSSIPHYSSIVKYCLQIKKEIKQSEIISKGIALYVPAFWTANRAKAQGMELCDCIASYTRFELFGRTNAPVKS